MSVICQCCSCQGVIVHSSDCAVHNEPAQLTGACTCGAAKKVRAIIDGISVFDVEQQAHNIPSTPCPGCGEVSVVVPLCPQCKIMSNNSNFM